MLEIGGGDGREGEDDQGRVGRGGPGQAMAGQRRLGDTLGIHQPDLYYLGSNYPYRIDCHIVYLSICQLGLVHQFHELYYVC